MKAHRKTICTQLLKRFTHDGERFLRSIITGDKSWVHHYDPESKMQSLQYRHKNSPAPFKVVASAWQVLLTIFWDMEGIVHIEFLEQGTTINSERYVSTLRALKGRLRRVRQDKVKDVVIHTPVAKPSALYSSWNFLPYHIRHRVLNWPRLTFSYFLCWRNISKEITMKRMQNLRQMFALGADPRHQNYSPTECENCTTLARLYWMRWCLCWKMIVHQIGETLSFHLMCNLLLWSFK